MKNFNDVIIKLGSQYNTDIKSNAKSIKNIVLITKGMDYQQRCKAIEQACILNGKSSKEYAAIFAKASKACSEKEAIEILKSSIYHKKKLV